jgi:hypothetical protein
MRVVTRKRCSTGFRMSRKEKQCVPKDQEKGKFLLGTKPWSKKVGATRQKASVYHNKAKETDRMTNFKPYKPNGKTLHLTDEPLERGEIEKNPKTQKLANRYHSMKRCVSYQKARRAFDQKDEEPWKTIYKNKHLCKWRKFFQRQKMIKFRQLNEEKKAGVTPDEWKTDAWIEKLRPHFTPQLRPDYIPTAADDALCAAQKDHPENYELTPAQKAMDARSVEDKCEREYNPYGGFVDEEDTIPLLHHTDYGFAKSNASLVKILETVGPTVDRINRLIDGFPALKELKLFEIVPKETLKSMIKEPFRKKLLSGGYDTDPEPDYVLSEKDEDAISQLIFNVLSFYFYKLFCDWLLKKIKGKMAKKTKPVRERFQEKYALLTKTVQALLFQNFKFMSEGSDRNLFLNQSQYLEWGQYDVQVKDPAFFDAFLGDTLVRFFSPNYLDDDEPSEGVATPQSPPSSPPRVVVPV